LNCLWIKKIPFKISRDIKRMSQIYNPLRNYIGEYFGNPILYRAKNVKPPSYTSGPDSIMSPPGLAIFVCNVQDMISSNHYIMASLPSSGVPEDVTQLHLADIQWTSFMTRTGKEYENFPSFSYAPPERTPLNEKINMTGATESMNTYKCVQLICKNIYIFTGKYKTMRQTLTFSSALETYNALVVL
jgi:hypothetical protein